ncbi:exo-alpha-sialidase [Ruania alba]|uniref:exo-alpha-sialidase n=1 Tax=Ruania alba TaxID=648782 RepID=UPI000B7D1722|nr:sialidase family protein [Ruania alba]
MSTAVPDFLQREFVAVDSPAWQQAHASSVLMADGAALVAWFGGTREGTPDNRIFVARRDSGAWSAPEVVAEGDVAHWNPVLATGPGGQTWLFFKRGSRISTWRTWVRRSADGGRTWSEAAELVLGPDGAAGRGPVKNPPVWLPGTWLAPASTETSGTDEPARWEPFVDRSTDGGRTWTPVPIPVDRAALRGPGLIQPTLVARPWGVLALMRSTEGTVYRSESTDGGRTWSPAAPTSLPNNNSGLTALSLPDGQMACVHNPVSGTGRPGARWCSR